MKRTKREGRGTSNNPRKAQIGTEEQENFMWDNSILGSNDPGKWCLLGMRLTARDLEHRNLWIFDRRWRTRLLTLNGRTKNKPG